jgi:hypothetical protein
METLCEGFDMGPFTSRGEGDLPSRYREIDVAVKGDHCFISFGTRYTDGTVSETPAPHIPEELALEVRRLAHELSNALEVIVQTSYLLGMAELKEPASEWLKMLDGGVVKALESNLQLREFIKKNTQH